MPAGWRRSKRCLGFTIANGRNMEILQDPQAPEGKRLVPTLGSVDRSDLFVRRRSLRGGPGRRRATVGADQPGRELRFADAPEVLTESAAGSLPAPPASALPGLREEAATGGLGRPAASAIPGGRGSLREEAATVGLGLRPAASSHGQRLSRQHAAAVGGALAVGSSWASAGLPDAGLPPASLRDNRCVTAPAPPGRIDLPDILQSQPPPPDKRGRYCRKSEENLRGPLGRPNGRGTSSLPKMGALSLANQHDPHCFRRTSHPRM